MSVDAESCWGADTAGAGRECGRGPGPAAASRATHHHLTNTRLGDYSGQTPSSDVN